MDYVKNVQKNKFLNNAKREVVMPRLDGSGPNGVGEMTGKRKGFCATSASNVELPLGGGCRRGFRNMHNAARLQGFFSGGMLRCNPYGVEGASSKNELSELKDEALILKKQIEAIQNRIEELQSK